MAQWLYNSGGKPVAFVKDGKCFSRSGQFIGRLDGTEIWHGSYKGEIIKGDRLLYRTGKGSVNKGRPGTPGTPGIPGTPGSKGSISPPSGYKDVDL